MILLEVPMSYYVEGASGRADIIIHMFDEEEKCLYPVTGIECKNEKILLVHLGHYMLAFFFGLKVSPIQRPNRLTANI